MFRGIFIANKQD